jgi:cysteine desulfurase/selenocysteine lyase
MQAEMQIGFDVNSIRKDFPVLQRLVNNLPLVYLDNAASTQKPLQVLNAVSEYNQNHHANIHRGIHTLSQEATLIYEQARKVVQQQIGALHTHEIIFTSGTTASINMAASILSERFLRKDDVVMVTEMEHHSNLLPWMNVCRKKGCVLKVIPVLDSGLLNLDWFAEEISKGVKILSFTHISNTLGVENPVKEMIAMAKEHGVIVVVDGAQAICHLNIDVVDLDADFYCFGAHKVYGPTGIGVMYAKEEYLNICEPWQWGGGIISKVSFDEVVLADLPFKYEAGTPNMEGAVGLSAAFQYLNAIGFDAVHQHEIELLKMAETELSCITGINILASGQPKKGVVSF